MGHVVDLLLIALWLLLEPLLLGRAIGGALNLYRGRKIESILFYYVAGYITNWAVFQIWAVPLILMRKSLTMLTLCWGLSILAVLVICLFISHRRKEAWVEIEYQTDNKLWFVIMTVAALVLILWQCSKYVFMMHLDEDDATFLADANSAYRTNTMFRYHWATGEELPGVGTLERKKDLVSPWVMFLAMMGRLMRLHPTILAHTVLPLFLLILLFSVYWLIGDGLFQHKRDLSATFVLIAAFCHLFFSGSKRTPAEFALLRIWQGKAIVAAILIPTVILFYIKCYFEAEKAKAYIACLFLCSIAMCALSSIGILFFLFMIVPYACWVILKNGKKSIAYLSALLVFPILYLIIYLKIR